MVYESLTSVPPRCHQVAKDHIWNTLAGEVFWSNLHHERVKFVGVVVNRGRQMYCIGSEKFEVAVEVKVHQLAGQFGYWKLNVLGNNGFWDLA
jgi:hypothetical protein